MSRGENGAIYDHISLYTFEIPKDKGFIIVQRILERSLYG